MSRNANEFERVTQLVAASIAGLLDAPVSVVDDSGNLIANTEFATEDAPRLPAPAASAYEDPSPAVRVPVTLDGRKGELVVATPSGVEATSPRVLRTLVDLMVNQVATANERAENELKNKFIYDLLHGSLSDEAEILRQGQLLGLDFSRPRAVILIDAAEYIIAAPSTNRVEVRIPREYQRAHQVISSIVRYFRLPSDAICAYIGAGEVAVLKASATKDLVQWANTASEDVVSPSWANLKALKKASAGLLARLQHDTNSSLSLGIGRYHPGTAGLARSYQDASAALSLGRRFRAREGVFCLDDLGMAAFVGISDDATKMELARYLLSPLDHEPDLLDTLSAFFDTDCCPSVAAKKLNVHRNTLGYRLDKIALLSGLDPRRFDDAVQMRLALLLRSSVGRDTNGASAQSGRGEATVLWSNA